MADPKVSTILDFIDNGSMALPQFQRGYVWNRDQVRYLFDSLYRRHPVGGLLVWVTESDGAAHRGDGKLAAGVVRLLLDGQQRITSLYGVIRGRSPDFFEGNARAFTDLYFHLENETFSFYQPVAMKGDPLWIDVTRLMQQGIEGVGDFASGLIADPRYAPRASVYLGRLSRLVGITDIQLHVEEVSGSDKTIDVIVDIFNRVNSRGTKLSNGDLALARICSSWPEARARMKLKLQEWADAGYHFDLDWLLRSVNTVLTGEAMFHFLHDRSAGEVQDGLERAARRINTCLNIIGSRLGLDHDRVFFGRYAVPVMIRYLDQRGGKMGERERDKLLFWYVQSGMWGRFSASAETHINQDLEVLEGDADGLDRLLEKLRLWHGGLRAEPGHFAGASRGARFYPVLYLLTRMGSARDWGDGTELKAHLLGKMNRLELHHIFPKAKLYGADCGFGKAEVNALANFSFLTKDSNLFLSDRLPEKYFPEVEEKHPGALASHWIPDDPELWKIKNYPEFLEARRMLLAEETNRRMAELLHGERHWLEGPVVATPAPPVVESGIRSGEEEAELEALNDWITKRGLPPGTLSYDFVDPNTGHQRAIFDLAWPHGIQEELTEPVAVLIDEASEVGAMANQAGFRCFVSIDAFKRYVETEVLAGETAD